MFTFNPIDARPKKPQIAFKCTMCKVRYNPHYLSWIGVAQNNKLIGKACQKEVKLGLPNSPICTACVTKREANSLLENQLSVSLCVFSP